MFLLSTPFIACQPSLHPPQPPFCPTTHKPCCCTCFDLLVLSSSPCCFQRISNPFPVVGLFASALGSSCHHYPDPCSVARAIPWWSIPLDDVDQHTPLPWLKELHSKIWKHGELRSTLFRTKVVTRAHYDALQDSLNRKHPDRDLEEYDGRHHDVLSDKLDILKPTTGTAAEALSVDDDVDMEASNESILKSTHSSHSP
jgi:hypothetical protein